MAMGCHHRWADRILILLLALLTLSSLHPSHTSQTLNPESQTPQNPSKTTLLTQIHSLLQKQEATLQTLLEAVTTLGASNGAQIDAPRREQTAAETKRVGVKESRGVTVVKYKPAWTERFQFLSAVRFEAEVTCLHLLPHDSSDRGVSRYVAVGDRHGRVYILTPSYGDLLVDFLTPSPSPVTAMLSYPSRNETLLVTGHADGSLLLHRLWEAAAPPAAEELGILAIEHVRPLAAPTGGAVSTSAAASALTVLEVHQVGKMRYIVAVSRGGRISVYRENGTRYGFVDAVSRPLVFLRQRLLFLTENGAGSLDLRSMTVKLTDCEGLNGSTAVTYAFDATERAKGYGFTSEGDLIHFLLVGDVLKFECRVRTKRKSEIEGPVLTQSIKGYLMVVTHEKIFVYNTTHQPYGRVGGPRPLFYASLDEIKSMFADSSPPNGAIAQPLIACNKERLVVVAFGDGHVGMYKSNLPVYKAEFNTMMWSSPVLVFVLFLFGAWQFMGKKREGIAIWGSDDPFSGMSPTGGVDGSGNSNSNSNPNPNSNPSSVIASERCYENRNRGPTRRYISPSRYPPGGAAAGAITYRANVVDSGYRAGGDANFRANAVDSGYRTGAEGGGYPKRRDARFSSTQNVEEKIH